jgi:hypothetical protein
MHRCMLGSHKQLPIKISAKTPCPHPQGVLTLRKHPANPLEAAATFRGQLARITPGCMMQHPHCPLGELLRPACHPAAPRLSRAVSAGRRVRQSRQRQLQKPHHPAAQRLKRAASAGRRSGWHASTYGAARMPTQIYNVSYTTQMHQTHLSSQKPKGTSHSL